MKINVFHSFHFCHLISLPPQENWQYTPFFLIIHTNLPYIPYQKNWLKNVLFNTEIRTQSILKSPEIKSDPINRSIIFNWYCNVHLDSLFRVFLCHSESWSRWLTIRTMLQYQKQAIKLECLTNIPLIHKNYEHLIKPCQNATPGSMIIIYVTYQWAEF